VDEQVYLILELFSAFNSPTLPDAKAISLCRYKTVSSCSLCSILFTCQTKPWLSCIYIIMSDTTIPNAAKQLSQYRVWLRTGRPGDRGSIPGKGKGFFLNLCVHTSSGAHPTSCTMGTRGPFPGAKARLGRDADHSPPSSSKVVNE
jgi:hypothetical protein